MVGKSIYAYCFIPWFFYLILLGYFLLSMLNIQLIFRILHLGLNIFIGYLFTDSISKPSITMSEGSQNPKTRRPSEPSPNLSKLSPETSPNSKLSPNLWRRVWDAAYWKGGVCNGRRTSREVRLCDTAQKKALAISTGLTSSSGNNTRVLTISVQIRSAWREVLGKQTWWAKP